MKRVNLYTIYGVLICLGFAFFNYKGWTLTSSSAQNSATRGGGGMGRTYHK